MKTFERVMRKYLVKYLEDSEFLHNNQHGFRKKRSCMTQLLSHIDQIYQSLNNNDEVDVIYLDFAKAFDKVDHSILLAKLARYGIKVTGSQRRKKTSGSSSRSPVTSPTAAKIKSKSGSAGKQCEVSIDITDSPSSLCRSLFDLSKCPCDRSLSSWKIDCSRCHQYWHSECVTLDGLEEKEINKLLNWLCPFCYTAPVATTDIVDSSSCFTCRNTRTLRDANHALEVSAAASNIKHRADNENIAGSMSMLSNETSIKCIEAELKQMHESCQTDIRKLVNEVTELKSELTKLSFAPLQAPPPSHSAINEHDTFLKSISDKLDAIINASDYSPEPCHPPEASSPPEPEHLADIEHHQVPYSDSIAEFITIDEAQRLMNYLDSCSYKNENGHSVTSFGESYTYTGSKSSSNVPPIPDELKPFFEKIQSIQTELYTSSNQNSEQTAPVINSCLINKYEGANSYLPRHSDSEVTIHPESSIFTISLGQLCNLRFIERRSGSESVLSCPDRSLYHMTRRSQEVFDHMIERGSIESGVRYSLTFRCVSWTNKNSTCLLGDSNTGLLRFGDDRRGTFGKLMPGRKFWSPRIEDINPVSCMGYANVVLLCGINDIRQASVENENDVAGCYNKLKLKIKQIQCLSPSTKAVFVCRLLPTKDPQLNLKVDKFNRLIFFDLVPSCKNVVYVEGFEKFAHNHVLADELSKQFDRHGRPDMLHLNRSGARVLAGLIKHSIFLRLNGGVDKRRHTSNVNGRLYRSVASDPPASQRRSCGFSFADDTKLIGGIQGLSSVNHLQDDLNLVIEWSRSNNMELHEQKFEVVSYNLNTSKTLRELPLYPENVKYRTPKGHVITPQEIVCDLGVNVSSSRGWGPHIEKTVQGARKMAAWVLSAFRDRSPTVMLTLYKSMVRSKLEYCCPVWNPVKITEIQRLENVQRSFTRKILGCSELQYWDRLKKLKLMSLQRRRERYCIIHVWKILNEEAPNDIGFTFNCHQRLGLKAVIPPVNKNSQLSVRSDYDSTFRVRAAQLFNILPPELRANTSLDGFKAGLGRFMEQCPDTPPIPDNLITHLRHLRHSNAALAALTCGTCGTA
ncbi:hypothetical protein ACHWQZ_G018912 [Mnemiopsis leidyi]